MMQKQNKQAQAAVRIGAALVLGALLMLKVLFSTGVNLINAGGIILERVNNRFSTRAAYTAAIDLPVKTRTRAHREEGRSHAKGKTEDFSYDKRSHHEAADPFFPAAHGREHLSDAL